MTDAPKPLPQSVPDGAAETITDILTRSVTEVFNASDAERRDVLMASTYSRDIVFADPEGTVTGLDAFAAKIAPLLAGSARLTFTLRGPIQESAGLGVARWQLATAGQPPMVTGTDVALVENGLVTRMWTLLDQ
ncbi:nuclear transport factor 2 family protein [Nakamurella sp. GG22]